MSQKIELEFQDRAYISNLLRKRSSECAVSAETSKKQGVKDDRNAEAKYAFQLAESLDVGEIEPDPSEITRVRDIKQTESPQDTASGGSKS